MKMSHLTPKNLVAFSGLVVIIMIAWSVQSHLLLNCDSIWLLLVAKRLVAGGTYTKDFFEVSPPLIPLLHTPPIYLANWLSINAVLAFRIYVFGLALVSFTVSYLLIRPVFLKKQAFLTYWFFVALAFTLFLLPAQDFGEREHLILIFTLPYFFAIVYRLQGNSFCFFAEMGIGFFAAIGFAVKPHYLIPVVLVETYIIFYTRNLRSWCRPDFITMMVMFVVYLIVVFIYFPDYIHTVIPIVIQFYYAGLQNSWSEVLFIDSIFFFCIAVLFYISQYRQNPYKILSTVLLLVTIGFMSAYLLQRTNWYYHALPFVAVAFLMALLLLSLFIIKHKNNVLLVILVAGLLLGIPGIHMFISYLSEASNMKEHSTLVDFLHTHANHQSVSYIGAFPDILQAVFYADSIYDSQFLHFFWMPGVVKKSTHSFQQQHSPQEVNAELSLINRLSQDIETRRPKLIFVDINEYKRFYSLIKFEYLPYLLKNPRFQAAWKPYHYITTIESPPPLNEPKRRMADALYLVHDLKQIMPQTISGNAVILVGDRMDRTAYLVRNHAFFKSNNVLFHKQVRLTEQESLRFFTQENKVIRIVNNQRETNKILGRAINFPNYVYQVYQREDIVKP